MINLKVGTIFYNIIRNALECSLFILIAGLIIPYRLTFSGNLVCQDHISAALALLVHSREIKDNNLMQMLADKANHHWREGVPHPKKDLILMRFATNGDKKIIKKKPHSKNIDEYYDQTMDAVSKNPWGDLCKSWGVYDHQEVFQRKPRYNYEDDLEEPEKIVKIKNKSLASRLGKRHAEGNTKQFNEAEESDSDSEWKTKSKAPRMRMHADDEESKQKKKLASQPSKDPDGYSALSIEVDNSRSNNYSQREHTKLSDKFKKHATNRKKHNIQSRLGEKVVTLDEVESFSSDNLSENSDSNVMSRVHKVNTPTSVWSRLDMKPSGTDSTSDRSDLRQILKSRKHKKSDDLRGKLGKSKQSNLRIEIDNNYAHDL